MVEVGKGASGGVRSQVFLQPRNHRRVGTTTSYFAAHRVQGDDVPPSQVVGVVAFGLLPCCRTEVVIVARSTWRLVLVVTHARLGTRLEASPGRIVAIVELARREQNDLEYHHDDHGQYGSLLRIQGLGHSLRLLCALDSRQSSHLSGHADVPLYRTSGDCGPVKE